MAAAIPLIIAAKQIRDHPAIFAEAQIQGAALVYRARA